MEGAADRWVQGRLPPEEFPDGSLLARDAGFDAGRCEPVGVVLGVVRGRDEQASGVLDAGRRDPSQHPVLDDALASGQRVLDDVATAGMEQAVVAATRAGPQVALLDQEAAEAASGEVPKDAGPGRSPADDEDVDCLDGRSAIAPRGGRHRETAARRKVTPPPRSILESLCGQAGTGSRVSDSTQSKVRVTAFFQRLYSRSRVASSIDGVHSLSLAQFARRSSTAFQKPTARPAA